MRTLKFGEAVDDALGQAMAADPRIVLIGEDVHMIHRTLYVRFGKERVRPAPISEAAFVGAAVGAALAGLRPVVEVMLVDFIAVAADALLNHAAKIEAFSGGRWKTPLVLRASCGGGYGDGGQHEQSLWGWLAHIPGLSVAVPSDPQDAGGLMLGALEHGSPVVLLEHKLLSEGWLEWMGRGGRPTVSFDVPEAGAKGPVPEVWAPLHLGMAVRRREGGDITLAGVGVDVHRALEAAAVLEGDGVGADVLDLRSVAPLDRRTLADSVRKTGRLIVVDEDYREFGLSGECAAAALESGAAFKFARVCTEETIPYARALEDEALPSSRRIVEAARKILG